MNSQSLSLIAREIFIRKFVLSIIRTIEIDSFSRGEKHVIHSDMVPKVSEKVMRASLGEKKTLREIAAPIKDISEKEEVSLLEKIAGYSRVVSSEKKDSPISAISASQKIAPKSLAPQQFAPITQEEVYVDSGLQYGKITPLLDDPSVSVIECQGPGKPLTIYRMGQRQSTRIFLGDGDIREILMKISDATHIPLLDGVFRTALESFSINAIISETIGSRFMIRKNSSYSGVGEF